MGSEKPYPKAKQISLLQQVFALRAAYPEAKCSIEGKTKLVWAGKIRPTPISVEYAVILTWEIGWAPHIWVVGDELQKLDDPDFPHKFEVDKENKMVRICLYRYQEFNSYKYLVRTIIPWIVEWLYFYEIWLATGIWCGGGEHPQTGIKRDEKTV